MLNVKINSWGIYLKAFCLEKLLVSPSGNWWRFHTFEYSIGLRCRRSSSSRRVVHIRRRWADSIHVADESSLWRKHDGVAGRVGLLLGTSWLPQAQVGMLQASTTLNLVHIKAILTDVYMLKHVLIFILFKYILVLFYKLNNNLHSLCFGGHWEFFKELWSMYVWIS